MVLISTGDGSGRPDTSGVDPVLAQDYARRMFAAVQYLRFSACRAIHLELNKDDCLYQAALDAFKTLCRKHGYKNAHQRWQEYSA